MHNLNVALQLLEVVVFNALAALAIYRWRTRGGRSRGLVALAFVILGLVVLVGAILPDQRTSNFDEVVVRVLVVLIALFPYSLYEFMATFVTPRRWVKRTATTLTLLAVIGASIIRLPNPGEKRTALAGVYTLLIVVQWIFILGIVGVRLWRSGRAQASVSKKRMHAMSLGALGMGCAIVLAAATPNNKGATHQDLIVQSITAVLALVSAGFFLSGFAPPSFLLASWRRPEIAQFREAEKLLMKALTVDEVGKLLLPHVTGMVGGAGSTLCDTEGHIIASHGSGISIDDLGAPMDIKMESGSLRIFPSAFTPYFGREELELLDGIAGLVDIALTRAEIYEEQRHSAVALKATNDAMKDFVASASHDLRTPVTVIQGFASTIRDDFEDLSKEQIQNFLNKISRQANHLRGLIDDLLMVSLIDANALHPEVQSLNLCSVVTEVTSDLDEGAETFALRIDSALEVQVDHAHLVRILRNYFENAMKYGKPPIEVTAETRDSKAELRVRDHGDGVPAGLEKHVFDRFARAKTTSGDKAGTGLGLSIVKGLAQNNGGDAWCEPTETGACFVVSFPVASNHEADTKRLVSTEGGMR